MDTSPEKPPFRWAGGKSWLLKYIHKFLPSKYNSYHEPFVGGGSVFFHLKPFGKSFLSDTNSDLINAYRQIQSNIDELINILNKFKNTKDEYYKIRSLSYNKPAEKAAQFIYLNRTGFNGIYRVNLEGRYNVPYGFKKYKVLFDFERLRRISNLLENSFLSCLDFELSLKYIKEKDLVFLDPPYTASHIKNCFIKYNERLFSWNDQIRLASYVERLVDRRAFFILTNAKHDAVKRLFGKFCAPISIMRPSVVGGKNAKREIIKEYIFSNTI